MGANKDQLKRIFGYSLLGLGFLAFFVWLSPLFPIRLGAFLMGLGFTGASLGLLSGEEFPRLWKRAKAALASRAEPRAPRDPLLPVKVLALAKQRAGLLTVSEAAIALKVPLDEAEAALEACVRSGTAVQDYDMTRGFTRYSFPEYLPPAESKDLLEP